MYNNLFVIVLCWYKCNFYFWGDIFDKIIEEYTIFKEKMWPLEHNSDEKEVTLKEGDAEKKEDEEKEICRQNNGKDKTTILIIYIECA